MVNMTSVDGHPHPMFNQHARSCGNFPGLKADNAMILNHPFSQVYWAWYAAVCSCPCLNNVGVGNAQLLLGHDFVFRIFGMSTTTW